MRFAFQFFFAAILGVSMTHAASLFGDRVVAKGKGVEVKASEVEEAFISYKANQAAASQPVPVTPEAIKKVEEEILDHLIATKIFLSRATDADRTNAAPVADKFIQEKRDRAGNEGSFRRQMLAIGLTIPQFEQQVRDQALVKSVVDRELRAKQTVTDDEIKKYYDENPSNFQEQEKWKVAHVHLANVDRITLKAISQDDSRRNDVRMQELARRAKAGEDFGKLVKEYSEDTLSKDSGGEYTMVRGQMPPEFEAATITLKPGQVSDVVRTRFGWHIIKLLEYIPPKPMTLAEAKDKIREAILQQKTQKALPDHIKQLRKELAVEILPAK